MTKAYTINRLIAEVRAVNGRGLVSPSDFLNALAPRGGLNSVKIQVLNNFLEGRLNTVLTTDQLNGSYKQRVISALRFRKKNGFYS